MKSKKKQMLLAAMAVSAMTLQPMAAYAEEAAAEGTAEKAETAELDSYTLDDVVVTATRTEKREVDIPESTEVVTAEDIKALTKTDYRGRAKKIFSDFLGDFTAEEISESVDA
ncbi:MAG: hypothetical protein IIZ29_03075, partial [Schwartzia sp.]|nr:hypothetical protein [Schwartzia sp. (in: firmicutes)]